jgi:alkaline phosphatase D
MQYNPHLNYIGNHRGYVRVTANATQLVADFQKVSSVVTRDPASVTLSTVRKYAVEDGVPGLHQV